MKHKSPLHVLMSLITTVLLVGTLACTTSKKTDPNEPEVIQLPEVQVEAPKVEIPKVQPLETPKENTEAHVGEASEYTAPVKPLPSATGYYTTNIVYQGCSTAYGKKIEEAAVYIKRIMNSQDFKDKVLNFTYNKKKQFVDNEKMTNAEVYNHLIGGAEALRPTLNYQMDLTVVCYTNNFVRTVGYTYPSENKIWVNMKYHNAYPATQVASNLVHEWSHKMGFGHAVNWSTSRDYSVPYGLNTIVESLASKAKADTLTPLK